MDAPATARPDVLAGPTRINPDLAPLARPVDALQLDDENVRLHADRNLGAIKASLTRFGQTKPVVCQAGTSPLRVVAGNGTLMAARALGWTHLAATVVELSDADARAYAIADNRTAELAEWDAPALEALMKRIGEDDPGMAEDLAFTQAELDALLVEAGEGLAIEPTALPKLPDGDRSPFRQQAFSLHETQDATVKRALALAIERGGGTSEVNTNRNGNALAAICRAYLEAPTT